jgi:hypothetical protein
VFANLVAVGLREYLPIEVDMREKTVSYEVAKRHLLDALSGAPRKPAKRSTRSSTSAAKPAAAAKPVVKRAATAPTRRVAR